MIDTVIRNGQVVDGTGAPAVRADVVIDAGKIVSVEPSAKIEGAQEWDARGKVVCPGFIDIHSHSDFSLLANRTAESAIAQGVTTLVTGNCGHGPSPSKSWQVTKRNTVGFSESWNVEPTWSTFGEYVEALFSPGLSVNVAPLVPHGTVRLAVMGHEARAATRRELEQMQELVVEAMSAGAVGLSSGLEYSPGCYADEDELVALASVAARTGGIYASHIRNRGDDFDKAVKEAISICRRAGLSGQLSHLAPRPYAPEGMFDRVLETIDAAREREGLRLGMDSFPDTWGPGPLATLLPPSVYEGNDSEVRERLQSMSVRDECRAYFDEPTNYLLRLGGFDALYLSCSKAHSDLVGQSFAEIFERMKLDPVDGICELLLADGADYYNVLLRHVYATQTDLDRLLSQPTCSLGSDGVTAATSGPLSSFTMNRSSYGYTARFIREYVIERGVFSLEEAIRKMTSLPARSAAIADRGTLEPEMAADVAVLDVATIKDACTDAKPQALPTGIELVMVNGVSVFDGRPTRTVPGRLVGR
jgi:N-acyl-D-aspartate/D-glutamate deacylase